MKKIDLLLIFPSLTKEESYGGRKVKKNTGGFLPPLGLASLAAFMIKKGYTVQIIEPVVMNMNLEDILNYIKSNQPKVIGLSILTSMYAKGVEFSKAIRKNFPHKIIIMGGHHVTLFNKNIFDNCPEIDVLVRGEGEQTLLELMNFFREENYDREKILANTTELAKIKGILFKDKDKIIATENRELINNLNTLPYPARQLLPMSEYVPLPIEYKRLPVVHMMVSRGCPFNCTYCSTHAAFGYKVRVRSPKKVVQEIKHVIKKYGARQISFWDDVLTINKKWLTELCDLIIKDKLDVVWNCYGHINTIDEEMLKKMKSAGCFCIWYGIEAGDEKLLKLINKGTNLKKIKEIVTLTKKNGIEVRGLFMIGLPGETPELAQKTINFAKELDVDYAQFSITTPHIGTQLYEDAKKYGKLKVDFNKFTQHSAIFVTNGYKNAHEVEKMAKRAFREFYFRPKYLIKQILKIRSLEDVERYYRAFKIALAFT